MNKKGIEMAFNTIIVAIIVLIVLVISIILYTKYIGRSAGELDNQIGALDDYDGDGTANMFDKCPCDYTCACIDGDQEECKDYREKCKDEMNKKNE